KRNYLAMRAHNHANQKLILGPWGHTDTSDRTAKNRDFGREATLDLQREYVRWFDYWLKGINNHIMDEPLVSMFTMGSNEWHTGNSYPLEATRFTKLYLAGKGNANSGLGNGLLSWEPSTQETEFDSYRYDPNDPTPDPTFYLPDHRGDSSAPPPSAQEEKEEERAYHNRVVNTRKDILVYRTPPLKEPLTLCGPVSAKIYASSSAGDTDWFVSLSEETDTEEVFPLVCGKIRARYRTSMFKPELLEKGRIYEYDLDLWHTGITIPAGRRIRIEIASALFPMFSRNLNTGGNNEMETESRVAEQKVYHCSAYPSHILLPVLP
ncbi:MAG: CocE/NonD family hydrolase, partial [Planctomycetota bacterium]